MVDETESKTVHSKEEGDQRGKRSKTLEFSRDKSHAKGSPSFT